MFYVDRRLTRISGARWAILYRDPHYAIVRETREPGLRIVTSWIGIGLEGERRSVPFMVQVQRHMGRDRWREIERPVHLATEDDAMTLHQRLIDRHGVNTKQRKTVEHPVKR